VSRFGASLELRNQRSSSPCAARRAPPSPASRNSVPTRAASPPKTSALSPSPSTGSGRSRVTAAFACRTSSVRGSSRCPVPAPLGPSPPLGPGSGRAPSTPRRSTKLEPTRDPELDGPASDNDGKLRRRRDELVLLSVAVPFAVALLGARRFSGHAACAASMHSRAPGPAGGLGPQRAQRALGQARTRCSRKRHPRQAPPRPRYAAAAPNARRWRTPPGSRFGFGRSQSAQRPAPTQPQLAGAPVHTAANGRAGPRCTCGQK
jgi:hypothetical protein